MSSDPHGRPDPMTSLTDQKHHAVALQRMRFQSLDGATTDPDLAANVAALNWALDALLAAPEPPAPAVAEARDNQVERLRSRVMGWAGDVCNQFYNPSGCGQCSTCGALRSEHDPAKRLREDVDALIAAVRVEGISRATTDETHENDQSRSDQPQPAVAPLTHATTTEAVCEWTLDADERYGDSWDSACGEKWCFIEGDPTANNVRFCQGCGGRVTFKMARTCPVDSARCIEEHACDDSCWLEDGSATYHAKAERAASTGRSEALEKPSTNSRGRRP